MNVYYQGNPGSYGHLASRALSPHHEPIQCATFADVHARIDEGNIGVLPIENSYMGAIHENVFHLAHGNYSIVGEYYQDVNHCLAGLGEMEDIREVYSQLPALIQTKEFCKRYGIIQQPFGDTAGSAHYVADTGDITKGAICSELAAEIYGLHIIKRNIQDQDGNTTRFVVVTKKGVSLPSFMSVPFSHKTSLLFTTKHKPGSLYKALGAFATRHINLSKIESMTTRNNPFEYMFWVDIDTPSPELFESAMEELGFFCHEITLLGQY